MLINTDITLRGYKYSKKKKHTYTHDTPPLQTVSYVSYLTRMNQFRNKDSGENSVCVRTLAWPILSYRSFNIDLIVRSNDKLLTMNRGTTRSVDISAQIFQTVIWETAVPRIEIPGTIHKPARTADVVELVCSVYWRRINRKLMYEQSLFRRPFQRQHLLLTFSFSLNLLLFKKIIHCKPGMHLLLKNIICFQWFDIGLNTGSSFVILVDDGI